MRPPLSSTAPRIRCFRSSTARRWQRRSPVPACCHWRESATGSTEPTGAHRPRDPRAHRLQTKGLGDDERIRPDIAATEDRHGAPATGWVEHRAGRRRLGARRAAGTVDRPAAATLGWLPQLASRRWSTTGNGSLSEPRLGQPTTPGGADERAIAGRAAASNDGSRRRRADRRRDRPPVGRRSA